VNFAFSEEQEAFRAQLRRCFEERAGAPAVFRAMESAEGFDRAVIEPLRHPACIGKARRHLVDDLLTFVGERGRQAREDRLDLVVRQPGRLASPFVRIGRVGRVPFAGDDADSNLALALGERVAGAEMRPERPHHLRQLGVVHIDLVRAGQPTARLNQRAIAFLLLGRHLLIGNLGIASKRGCLGHGQSPRLKRAVKPRPTCGRAPARDRR